MIAMILNDWSDGWRFEKSVVLGVDGGCLGCPSLLSAPFPLTLGTPLNLPLERGGEWSAGEGITFPSRALPNGELDV